jgi:curli biogenesis system outer membrane secretion channel CsgG
MKITRSILTMTIKLLAAAALFSCASQDERKAEKHPVYSADSLTLDEAIAGMAAYFTARLPAGSTTAIVSFEAASGGLEDYIFEELWGHFEDSGKFIMVDRRNLDRIRAEMNYQMSGEVSDESARSIGRQYGAQTIVYGRMIPMGEEYRLSAYATDVETASGSQRAFTVRPDKRLGSLLKETLDDQIDRAVVAIARGWMRRSPSPSAG